MSTGVRLAVNQSALAGKQAKCVWLCFNKPRKKVFFLCFLNNIFEVKVSFEYSLSI